MKSLTTFVATALVLFAFGQAIAAKGAEVPVFWSADGIAVNATR